MRTVPPVGHAWSAACTDVNFSAMRSGPAAGLSQRESPAEARAAVVCAPYCTSCATPASVGPTLLAADCCAAAASLFAARELAFASAASALV